MESSEGDIEKPEETSNYVKLKTAETTKHDERENVASENVKVSNKIKRFLPRTLSQEKYGIGSTLRLEEEEDDNGEGVKDNEAVNREQEEREERKEADHVYGESVENAVAELCNEFDGCSQDRITENTELLIHVMEESKRKRRSSWKSAWDDDDDQFNENAEMNDGEKLLWAAENNHIDIIEELYEQNPNLINVSDNDGYTPLHRASYNDHTQAIEMLLKLGANVKAKTADGWQPIHSACKWNNAQVASLLLQNGADINSQTNGGQTPLHLASTNSDGKETLELLLTNRFINVELKNAAQETAFEIAKRSGRYGYLFDIHAQQLNDFTKYD
ncbi:ankyrin repeat domain-containing protein 49-like [Saccoglossus kowalevskii]|uniref:Ankyrin repeat domain-containing protein 49-like n=1 Tax=Saccoglossus kowalevskii TaxID=10224 RepID=A0ABM0GUQ2_SACKO|nr:PREDICTED: ankyrin repeat domain-containing protein 49-like [Saccoglossus kowalevskii]